jgi:uncharacterized HhH-GPD family protein
MPTPPTLRFTDDPDADRLLAEEPLALLIGMLLDQQVPMEWAFKAPSLLKARLGGRLDCAEIAAMDPEKLRAAFTERPALHRYPGSMADRVHSLCREIVDEYGGHAEQIWADVGSGDELLARLKALPGFGDQKARIFLALLAKRLGVTPAGWQEAAGTYGTPGYYSIADVDGPESLAKVREYKQAVKAKAKAKAAKASA